MEYGGGVEIGRLIFHCCAEWPISSLLISNGSILILLISHWRGISFRFVRDVWLITRPFETRIPVEEGFICVSFYLFIYVCVDRESGIFVLRSMIILFAYVNLFGR